MKHSRFEKFMPEQITNVVKDFNENNGEDDEDEEDKPKASAAKRDTRSDDLSEIYDVPTIENLRPTVQLLMRPGADVSVNNPLSDSPVAGRDARGPITEDSHAALGEGPAGHLLIDPWMPARCRESAADTQQQHEMIA